jgi:hypothetical protein
MRRLLFEVFKTSLPCFLRPQPAILVIDQTDLLLCAYRADFLVRLSTLTKELNDQCHYRLVLVVCTENAVKALELIHEDGTRMLQTIQTPNVSREAVVESYGESFAKVFDDCDSCIGIAVDYRTESTNMTAKEYTAKVKENLRHTCLSVEITREEYTKAQEQSRKKIKKSPC